MDRQPGKTLPISVWVLLLFIGSLTVSDVHGQEGPGRRTNDTADVRTVRILDPGVSLGRPTILLPSSLRSDFLFQLPPRIGAGAYGDGRSGFPFISESVKADLISPYLLQNKRAAELQNLYTVLGAVELAGVAYLAYRQIRDYGFSP